MEYQIYKKSNVSWITFDVIFNCSFLEKLYFLIIPLFILFITKNQILPEEEALENIFGEEYGNYKRKLDAGFKWILLM